MDSDSSIPVRAGGVTTIDIKVIATISQSEGVVTEVSKTYTIRVTRPARVEDDRGSRNQSPFFVEGRQTARSVAENTPAGQNTGEAIAATDPTDDPLIYALLGRDAALFDIDPASGRLLTKASLDYEAKSSYQATVRVRDDGNASDSIDVTITIANVEEAGTVSVSPGEPEVGTALTASLSDPDGSLSDISWQ